MALTLLKAATVLAMAQQVLGACYRPNGTDRNISPSIKDGEAPYQPCNTGSGHSMCCNVKSFDQCRPNGLCYTSGKESNLWRESCTDPTWKDPACIKLCAGADQLNEKGEAMSGIDSVITVCGDGSLCCGSGDFSKRCCDANKGFKIVNGAVVEAHPTPKTTPKPAPVVTVTPETPETPEKETVTKTKQAEPSPDTNNGGNNNGGDSKDDDTKPSSKDSNNNVGAGASPTTSAKKEAAMTKADEEDGTKSESGLDAKASSPANSSEDSRDDATPTGKSKGNQDSKDPKDSTKDDLDDASSDNTDKSNPDSTDSNSSGSSSKKNGHGSTGNEEGGETSNNGGGSNAKSSALIGGVVGGVLGGLILLVITAWFVIRKRRATKGERYINTLGSSSELPGSDGRTFHEVQGDYKFPAVAQVQPIQTIKGGELAVGEYGKSYYEMDARSTVP